MEAGCNEVPPCKIWKFNINFCIFRKIKLPWFQEDTSTTIDARHQRVKSRPTIFYYYYYLNLKCYVDFMTELINGSIFFFLLNYAMVIIRVFVEGYFFMESINFYMMHTYLLYRRKSLFEMSLDIIYVCLIMPILQFEFFVFWTY